MLYNMTWEKELFIELDETITRSVRMANDTYSQVKCIGSVKFVNKDNSEVILTKVRYIQA